FVKHDPQFYERAVNNYKLYQLKQVPIPPTNHTRVNAGVCGFDIIRDNTFLQKWRCLVEECRRNEYVRSLIHYQDQGCLNFLLQSQFTSNLIEEDSLQWNRFYPMTEYRRIGGKVASFVHLNEIDKCLLFLQNEFPNTKLLHWAGPSK